MLGASSTDNELWEAIITNDDRGFTLLFDRYWLRLYKTALYFSKDEEVSKDIVNNVFLNIWNSRNTLQIQDFVPYLNAAVRFEVFRFVKKRKSSMVTYVDDFPVQMQQEVHNDGVVNLGREDLENQLRIQLKKLPKRCAAIFHMSKIEQLKNEEIAEKLGITKHTVENQLSYAVKHMKMAFKDLSILLVILQSLRF